MVLLEDMPTKATSPDGYDYTCKHCHSKYNKSVGNSGYLRWKLKSPLKALITGRRADAVKRGIEFTITENDISIPDICPVLGIPIIVNIGNPRNNNSPSIDRIDNNKGYVPGNAVVISWRANLLKKDASIAELRMLAEFYSQFEKEES